MIPHKIIRDYTRSISHVLGLPRGGGSWIPTPVLFLAILPVLPAPSLLLSKFFSFSLLRPAPFLFFLFLPAPWLPLSEPLYWWSRSQWDWGVWGSSPRIFWKFTPEMVHSGPFMRKRWEKSWQTWVKRSIPELLEWGIMTYTPYLSWFDVVQVALIGAIIAWHMVFSSNQNCAFRCLNPQNIPG